jgi:hypothetical protein
LRTHRVDPFLASQDLGARYDITGIDKKGDTYWVGILDAADREHSVDSGIKSI